MKKNRRSKLQDVVLGRMEECWHTIYVRKSNKSVCHEICKQNKLKGSFYIIVPSPLYNAKKEEWISLRSGFKYTYREHFIIDVVYLKHLKKIRNVVELHFNLSHLSVGSVNLIQPFNCHNTRFCIVSNCQFSILRKNQQMEMMSTGSNSYLYEYSDKASWSLPGCVVSSWETNDDLPEFSMKDVENVVKAVGGGTTRKRTQNRGIYLTLGPRLSSRPRPNPVIQDKTKLYFSDFYRQNWVSQELMYLIRCKVSHGSECIRKRSIALDPGYMDLVGHHCCARQLLTSGVVKSKAADVEGHATLEKPMNSQEVKRVESWLLIH